MAAELVPSTPDANTALVRPSDTPAIPEWMSKASVPAMNTLDMTKPNAMQTLSKVSIGCDQQLSDLINEEIEIESWYAAPYEKVDEKTGELIQLVYIGLISPTGVIYGCSSIGVRRSLLLLSQQFGFRHWIPAVKVKVRAVKVALGKMFALEFVSKGTDATANNKKGK